MRNNLLPISVTFKSLQLERFINKVKRFLFMEQEKLQQELEQFKKHLVLNYSLREVTRKSHLENIKRMLREIETTDPEKEEVTNYIYEIKNSNKSCSHVCNNISSVEKYMDFKKKLVRYAKPKRQRKLIVDVLTEAEINRMVQSSKNIKEKAMFLLLIYSGVRVRSFCNIKLRDVDFGENTIRVRKVKGRKEYLSNISSDCIKVLLKYLEKYPKKLDDFLFTTKVRNNQYASSDIRKLINVLSVRAKIEKNVYPHLLRHSLASNMLNRGANIILIKEQLGHDWIQSTENYLSCFPQRIKSEFEIYKPSYI